MGREREGEKESKRDRERDREREGERQRERDRGREREGVRHTDRYLLWPVASRYPRCSSNNQRLITCCVLLCVADMLIVPH